MPRAVLDTNVLVSALITPVGAPAKLLVEWRAGAFELVVSAALLDELLEVLHRERFRRYVSTAEAAQFVDAIRNDAIVVDDPPAPKTPVASDPDDEFLATLARVARVDALVSGDAGLLEPAPDLPVMRPAEFLAHLSEGLA